MIGSVKSEADCLEVEGKRERDYKLMSTGDAGWVPGIVFLA